MNGDQTPEEVFAYIQDQERNWRDLNYNEYMERINLDEIPQGFMSDDSFKAYIQKGAIQGDKITNLSARQLQTSTLIASLDVGKGMSGAHVKIDGPNNRIMIRDESGVDRILIGFQKDGF